MFEELGSGSHAGGGTTGIVNLVGLVVFIASFAFSLGPVVWTIINEIFPSHIRGKAVAVATGANWFSAWLVAQFFLSLARFVTEAGTFWLFAAFCLATLAFAIAWCPRRRAGRWRSSSCSGASRANGGQWQRHCRAERAGVSLAG
jgi:hypothetical protein